MNRVTEVQVDLINSNRVSSVITMSAAAIIFYTIISPTVESSLFLYWLIAILSVDAFRLVSVFVYIKDKKNNQINYSNASQLLLIGTILSATCWGALSIILFPIIDFETTVVVILMLASLATASTTTLSYKYHLTFIFVLFVLSPIIIMLTTHDNFDGNNLIFLDVILLVMIIFLLKNTIIFYRSHESLIQLQVELQNHESELVVQRQNADNANVAKSDFLANMSHELRTPMHAILGFSNLGEAKVATASREKIAGYFSRINESGQRLLILLNDLLDLSKLESGKMTFLLTEHDLQNTIENVVNELNPLFRNHSLTVDIEPPKVDTIVTCDKEKITQVVQNLFSNAIKYTPDGMSVMVYYEETKLQLDDKEVPALSISIMDQGVGIPDGELELVFDKFVQSSNTNAGDGGTGLGLSISKEIIEHHSGKIRASNSAGAGGAVFTFTLPYSQADAA